METRKYEFDISLVQSNKWNLCIKLEIFWEYGSKSYFWSKAVKKISYNPIFFNKEDLKYIKELKNTTDKTFMENKKLKNV